MANAHKRLSSGYFGRIDTIMEIVLLIIGVILLCLGLSFSFNWIKNRGQETQSSNPSGENPLPNKAAASSQPILSKESKESEKSKKPALCPICSSVLKEGERVKSTAVPLANGGKLLHISGCPHCLYGEEKRTCPVCSAEITKDEILAATMTTKDGKNAVKIFGCSHCGGKAATWMRHTNENDPVARQGFRLP